MLKYRIVCGTGCIKDVRYCDSSSHIQKLKANALKNEKKNDKNNEKSILKRGELPDKNATHHTVTRLRRGGASAPKKCSV